MKYYLLQRDGINFLYYVTWKGLISHTSFKIIEWIIHLFSQKEGKVTFLLPSINILGEGEVYMLGPRIPVHNNPCMFLHYITKMKIAATHFQFFQT